MIQGQVLQWAVATFGPIAAQMNERGLRFVEEAVEVAQAAGVTESQMLKIMDRVYRRPAGAVQKEIPQAGLTLACLAAVANVDLEQAVKAEFERIQEIPAIRWRERHEEKRQQGIISQDAPTFATLPNGAACLHPGVFRGDVCPCGRWVTMGEGVIIADVAGVRKYRHVNDRGTNLYVFRMVDGRLLDMDGRHWGNSGQWGLVRELTFETWRAQP